MLARCTDGRGWQLLRSRGANSNATGPCDPPQLASSCTACEAAFAADDVLPACVPTRACGSGEAPAAPQPMPSRAAILFAIDANASNLRFFYGRLVRKAYTSQIGMLVRSVLSLRRVNTTLPIVLLASGDRVPAVEERLQHGLGVRVLGADAAPKPIVPRWGSKWARGSFAKLRALALSEYERLIVLDTDTLVLRNIDHLVAFPA